MNKKPTVKTCIAAEELKQGDLVQIDEDGYARRVVVPSSRLNDCFYANDSKETQLAGFRLKAWSKCL